MQLAITSKPIVRTDGVRLLKLPWLLVNECHGFLEGRKCEFKFLVPKSQLELVIQPSPTSFGSELPLSAKGFCRNYRVALWMCFKPYRYHSFLPHWKSVPENRLSPALGVHQEDMFTLCFLENTQPVSRLLSTCWSVWPTPEEQNPKAASEPLVPVSFLLRSLSL